MSLWKTIKIEPAMIQAVEGKYLVLELKNAESGSRFCVEDPAFVSDPFDLRRGCFVELHTRVSQLVSHRTSYAIELCDSHEQRHLGATWNFRVLYGDTQ